jgi:hypothetical protein
MSYLKKMERKAEATFLNFSGNQDRDFLGYGGSNEELDPNDRTLTITVINANTVDSKVATIFGAVRDLNDNNLDADLTILVAESSHQEVKTELLQNILHNQEILLFILQHIQELLPYQ